MIYFDHNATSPICDAARAAWLDATERFIGNPSSPHRLGARADRALDEAREKPASYLQCDAMDIVWTSGATESANMVVHHWAGTSKGEAWVSAIEHPCVIEAVRRYFPGRHRLIPVDGEGIVDLGWLRDHLSQGCPAFIGIMATNNETGVLQPWQEARALCEEFSVPFFSDAAQWIGKLPAAGLGSCQFVSGCGHKFGGPLGVGFLKCPAKTRALLVGGKQEQHRRAGTENVPGVLALVAALDCREEAMRKGETERREQWIQHFVSALESAFPTARLVGSRDARLWNTAAVIMPEVECHQRWVVRLDRLGFAVSTGSACSSGQERISYVLEAMGLTPSQASRVLRFSSGWEADEDDWVRLLQGVTAAHDSLKHRLLEA